jgi:hypothetical protein
MAPQLSHVPVSAVVPPPPGRPLDSKRSVLKLILLAIGWMLVFWVSSLFLAGFLAGILNPKNTEDVGRKVGESLSGLFFLIALGLSIWLTVAGKLPGTKRTPVAPTARVADGSTIHLSSRSRRAIIATVPVLIILGAAAWYLGHKKDVPAEKVSEPIAEQQVAGAKPAEHVIPHDNTPDAHSAASPTKGSRAYQKPTTAKLFAKASKGPFGVWIDPQKWQRKSSEDPIKIIFTHKTGDAYAMVISERISVPTDSLKKIALANAKAVAPDVKVVSEEKRIVNGKEVLCLETAGTTQGIPFTYYGYYYGGSEGTLQVVTYTSSNIFDEYKRDFDDFLNGTQIGQEPATGKVFAKARKGPFGVWIDPQKWKQDSSEEDPIKITFNHEKGDAYAMVISERVGVPTESLKKVALENAKKVTPDVKIVSEEKRIVNGKELLCLKLTAAFQGIPIIYYGYYYGGSEGTLQVVTYTSSNIFDEYKQDFDDFLNGTQIGQ